MLQPVMFPTYSQTVSCLVECVFMSRSEQKVTSNDSEDKTFCLYKSEIIQMKIGAVYMLPSANSYQFSESQIVTCIPVYHSVLLILQMGLSKAGRFKLYTQWLDGSQRSRSQQHGSQTCWSSSCQGAGSK